MQGPALVRELIVEADIIANAETFLRATSEVLKIARLSQSLKSTSMMNK